jgi:hypothetical protein
MMKSMMNDGVAQFNLFFFFFFDLESDVERVSICGLILVTCQMSSPKCIFDAD